MDLPDHGPTDTLRNILQLFEAKGLEPPTVTTSNGQNAPVGVSGGMGSNLIEDPAPASPAPPAPSAPPTEIKRRGRPPKAAAPPPPSDDTGLADTDAPEDLAGPVDPDEEDALGLTQPSMTGKDALELALGKVRVIYARGNRGPVKELQQKMGIASFTDIPPSDGHRFLALVIKLEEQLGMRV